MNQLVHCNLKPTDKKMIKLQIYYKSKKISHLLLKNDTRKEKGITQKSNVIYRFSSTKGNCAVLSISYIGMMKMRLSQRFTFHLSAGAPKKHLQEAHEQEILRSTLEDNTEILDVCHDKRWLEIAKPYTYKNSSQNLTSKLKICKLFRVRVDRWAPAKLRCARNHNLGQSPTNTEERLTQAPAQKEPREPPKSFSPQLRRKKHLQKKAAEEGLRGTRNPDPAKWLTTAKSYSLLHKRIRHF